MRQIQTKTNTIQLRTIIRTLSLLVALPFVLTGLQAKAAELSPESVIRFTNEERVKKNLPVLVENEALSKAAALKAQDMLANNYFSHTSPTGRTPWHWIEKSGYKYEFAGENLAINFTSASEQGAAWMNSKTHRENILSSQYTEVGVAVISGQIKGKTSFVTVQLFGKPVVPVVAQKNTNTESGYGLIPMVKGAQTEIVKAGTKEYFQGYVQYYQTAYQNMKANILMNQDAIRQGIGELALILIFTSLTAPGIVFVSFSFREMLPKYQHFSSG